MTLLHRAQAVCNHQCFHTRTFHHTNCNLDVSAWSVRLPCALCSADVVAIKAVPSGDVATSSKEVKAKSGAVTSGKYT